MSFATHDFVIHSKTGLVGKVMTTGQEITVDLAADDDGNGPAITGSMAEFKPADPDLTYFRLYLSFRNEGQIYGEQTVRVAAASQRETAAARAAARAVSVYEDDRLPDRSCICKVERDDDFADSLPL